MKTFCSSFLSWFLFLFFLPPFLGASSSTWDFLDWMTSTFWFFHWESVVILAPTSIAYFFSFWLTWLALFQSSLIVLRYEIKMLHNSISPMYFWSFSCCSYSFYFFSYYCLFFSLSISLTFLLLTFICHSIQST